MRRFSSVRGLALLAVCAGAVLAGWTAPARAYSLTQLPASITSPSMVVDPGGQHVFVSGGPGQSTIVVLNFSGAIVKTITDEPGASQMAVDPSTHTLYVALSGANAIGAIDTQSLTETSRFSVAPLAHPYSVVIAGGELWFSNINGYNHGYVASMNFDGSGVAERDQDLLPGSGANYTSVQLSSGGANNGLLATVQASGGISLYDVSSGSVSQVTGPYSPPPVYPHGSPCSDFYDFSVDPLGEYVLYASYSCAAALATSPSGTSYYLPTDLSSTAVAWSPDGQYVAVSDQAKVEVFPRGSTQPTWGWAKGTTHQGLAFSPDGTHVFAIVGSNGGLGFEVLDRYTTPDTQITSGPAEASSTYDTSASFAFSSHNAPATFQCDFDGSGWNDCSSPQNLGGLSLGSHTFKVRSLVGSKIDTVGETRTWTVKPPNTKITSGPGDSTYAHEASFAFTSDDSNSLVYMCKLDAQEWYGCTSPAEFVNLAPGSHTFKVKAEDGANHLDVDPVGAAKTWTILPGGQKLNVVKAGAGFGSIKSTPAGIACNRNCSAWYAPGTAVTLTAIPGIGSRFSGWSGACSGTVPHCVVSMTQARTVTATFVRWPKQLLTVKKSGAGTVKSSPIGISCGSNCTHKFAAQTVVTLSATALAGSTFSGWSGSACSGTGTCVVTMSAAKTVKAKFTLNHAAHRAGR